MGVITYFTLIEKHSCNYQNHTLYINIKFKIQPVLEWAGARSVGFIINIWCVWMVMYFYMYMTMCVSVMWIKDMQWWRDEALECYIQLVRLLFLLVCVCVCMRCYGIELASVNIAWGRERERGRQRERERLRKRERKREMEKRGERERRWKFS